MLPGNTWLDIWCLFLAVAFGGWAWAEWRLRAGRRLRKLLRALGRQICIGIPDPEDAARLYNGLNDSDPSAAVKEVSDWLQKEWYKLNARAASHVQLELQAATLADAGPILDRYRAFAKFMNENFKYDCARAQKQHPPLTIFEVAENLLLESFTPKPVRSANAEPPKPLSPAEESANTK
jgi:hypothetical protein